MPKILVSTARRWLTLEAISLYNACKSLSFRCACNINKFSRLKNLNRNLRPYVSSIDIFRGYPKLFEKPYGSCRSFFEMSRQGFIDTSNFLNFIKSNLERIISLFIRGLFLNDLAWSSFYYGNRHGISVVIKNLCHAEFFSKESKSHFLPPPKKS